MHSIHDVELMLRATPAEVPTEVVLSVVIGCPLLPYARPSIVQYYMIPT